MPPHGVSRSAALDYIRFWEERAKWPRDTADYVFLGRAVHRFGEAMYPGVWTGDESTAEPVMLIPEQSAAQRRDRLEAHRVLSGNPNYTVKRDDTRFPGSLNSMSRGVTIHDYRFTDLEWGIARGIQRESVEQRRPLWARLHEVQSAIAEHATFGRLGTACRKTGAIALNMISADAWAVYKLHEVFAYCTVPHRFQGLACLAPLRQSGGRVTPCT